MNSVGSITPTRRAHYRGQGAEDSQLIEREDDRVEIPPPSGRCWFGQLEALLGPTTHPNWPDPLHSEGVDSAT
ncbi:MAG: hypothetical protein ACREOS_07860 [Candidatus Dormibacteraceae bacterium]